MKITEIDTPALLIDKEIVLKNLDKMQKYADKFNVSLRPHTKTHKMPYFAKLQVECGAKGITVAKVGEAEVMAKEGLSDIFIANEIVTRQKFARIIALVRSGVKVSFGVDSVGVLRLIDEVFGEAGEIARLLVEIEVGENRSGVIEEGDLVRIYPNHICPVVNLYDYAYLVSGDEVCEKVPVLARGRVE